MLTDNDRARIAAAITAAETKTSGEIACVLAHEASHYREVPVAWAALTALVLPPVALVLGFKPLALAQMVQGWSIAQQSEAGREVLLALTTYTVIQAVLFVAVALLVSIPPVRRALTPKFLKRHRVQEAAHLQFAASGVHLPADLPHVLIYASAMDHAAEIVASPTAHAKAGADTWDAAAAALVDGMRTGDAGHGFTRAIEISGEALAAHFPPDGRRRNMLPDTLLET